MVSKPNPTGCFSSDQTAPDRLGLAGVRRKTLPPETAASPTSLSPCVEAKDSKRIVAAVPIVTNENVIQTTAHRVAPMRMITVHGRLRLHNVDSESSSHG